MPKDIALAQRARRSNSPGIHKTRRVLTAAVKEDSAPFRKHYSDPFALDCDGRENVAEDLSVIGNHYNK